MVPSAFIFILLAFSSVMMIHGAPIHLDDQNNNDNNTKDMASVSKLQTLPDIANSLSPAKILGEQLANVQSLDPRPGPIAQTGGIPNCQGTSAGGGGSAQSPPTTHALGGIH